MPSRQPCSRLHGYVKCIRIDRPPGLWQNADRVVRFVFGQYSVCVPDGTTVTLAIAPEVPVHDVRPTLSPASGPVASDGQASPEELIRLYGEYMRGRRAEKYAANVLAILVELSGKTGQLAGVTRRQIEDFLSCGDVSPKWRNNRLSSLRAFYDWAKRAELVLVNPCDGVERWRDTGTACRAFTAAEVQAIIEAARVDEAAPLPACRWQDGSLVRRADLYRFLAITGMRVGEATVLRWRNFQLDLHPPRVTLPPGLTRKATRGRTVTLTEPDAAWLTEARRERLGGDQDDLVFREPNWRVIHRDMKAAGVAERDHIGRTASLHSFRRFAATALALADLHPLKAQVRLGHTNLATTLRIYTDAEQMRESAAGTVLSELVLSDHAVEKKDFPPTTGVGIGSYTDGPSVENRIPCEKDLKSIGDLADTSPVQPTTLNNPTQNPAPRGSAAQPAARSPFFAGSTLGFFSAPQGGQVEGSCVFDLGIAGTGFEPVTFGL